MDDAKFIQILEANKGRIRALLEPNEGACEMRIWVKSDGKYTSTEIEGVNPRCSCLGTGECVNPNTDQVNCPVWKDWNK